MSCTSNSQSYLIIIQPEARQISSLPVLSSAVHLRDTFPFTHRSMHGDFSLGTGAPEIKWLNLFFCLTYSALVLVCRRLFQHSIDLLSRNISTRTARRVEHCESITTFKFPRREREGYIMNTMPISIWTRHHLKAEAAMLGHR